jgi:hypothetical protein
VVLEEEFSFWWGICRDGEDEMGTYVQELEVVFRIGLQRVQQESWQSIKSTAEGRRYFSML